MCMCACVKNLCVKDFSVRCQLKRRVRMVSLQAACALYTVLFSTFTEAVKIIRAASGSFVHLPCPLAYNDSDTVVVNWTKVGSSNTLCSYRVERGALSNISSCKPHVNLTGHPPELYLTKLKISDAGIYNCKMSKVIPPPTEETFITLQLHVEDSPGVYIKKVESNQSDCQWLLCQLERLDPAEVNFTWSREGQRIPSGSSAGSLHLCKSDWNEGDTFTCTVSFNNTHFINSITLNGTNGGCCRLNLALLIPVCVGVSVGIVLLICAVICICKKRGDSSGDGSIVFTNKVYENFSFSTAAPRNQRADTLQHEQCIYEN